MENSFNEKKQKLATLLEEYIEHQENCEELNKVIIDLSFDDDFKNKGLFQEIFVELKNSLGELSRKELKQRVLMIRTFE